MSEGKTIHVGSESKDSYFNVDNVAYFKSTNSSLTTIAQVILVTPAAVGLVMTAMADHVAWTVIGVASSGYLFHRYSPDDGLSMGTLDGSTPAYSGSIDSIEEEFKAKSGDTISIGGNYEGQVYESEYVYHFVVDNIVSVESSSRSYALLKLIGLLVAGIIVFFGFGVFVPSPDSAGPPGIEGYVIGGIIMGSGLYLAKRILSLTPDHVLKMSLSNGEEVVFHMNVEDLERVLGEFKDY